MKLLSRAQLFATLWAVAYRTPPSMGFSRQEYWSGLSLPSPIYSKKKKKRKVGRGGGGGRAEEKEKRKNKNEEEGGNKDKI